MNQNRVTNNLLALGSAAVLAVYAAGYVRTRPAAQRFASEARERRPVASDPIVARPDTTTKTQQEIAAATSVAPKAQPVPKRTVAAATDTPTQAPADTAAEPDSAVVVQTVDTVTQRPAKPLVQYKDGTYIGWGTSRHGEIKATVEIREGRIISAAITLCLTQYSCSWISELPAQVVERQSPETDYVSGATQSTNAFYYAVVQALSKAK